MIPAFRRYVAASDKGSRKAPSAKKSIDVLEVGGRGGVFQHSLALCLELQKAGHTVTLHTATDCEIRDPLLEYCLCFDWKRNRNLRSVKVALHFLTQTIPHIARRRNDATWVQGTFKPVLTLCAIVAFRLARKRVIFSPHNLFSRRGSRVEAGSILAAVRMSSQVVVYNSADADRLASCQPLPELLPLVMYAPSISAGTLRRWSALFPDPSKYVCALGQMRRDKNIGLLIDACRQAGTGLVVMGPAADGQAEAQSHLREGSPTPVLWLEGYYPLEDMAAVVALIGTVALPYAIASQSAVAELASAYGATVIAYDIGGLSEQADVLVGTLRVDDWADAIRHRPASTQIPMEVGLEPRRPSNARDLVNGFERILSA